MEITNLIVARYLDGRLVKGVTRDFSPNRPIFHVDLERGGDVVELRFKQLKALFFVRALEGDPARQDVRGFVHGPAETQQGKKIAVRFRDAELLCGYTLSWSPDREGFFMFPADANSNNQRIFVIDRLDARDQGRSGRRSACAARARRSAGSERCAGVTTRPQVPDAASAAAPRWPTAPQIGGRRPSGFLPRPPRGGTPEQRTGSD